MTETKLVDICNVEALDPTEAKAAFLSLYKQQRPWIKITNDPETEPPVNKWVVVRFGYPFGTNEHVASKQYEGNYMVCFDGSCVMISCGESATHWRPI